MSRKKQRAMRSAASKQCDYVSDREIFGFRCRWQEEEAFEQEETTSNAQRRSKQCDYVSDRGGRWFESNLGSHEASQQICCEAFFIPKRTII